MTNGILVKDVVQLCRHKNEKTMKNKLIILLSASIYLLLFSCALDSESEKIGGGGFFYLSQSGSL